MIIALKFGAAPCAHSTFTMIETFSISKYYCK